MKKILLFVLPVLMFGLTAKAQLTYNVTADTAYANLQDDGVSHKAYFEITNPSMTDSVVFQWRMAKVAIPSDWTAPGTCDWINCYQFTDLTWHDAPIEPNATKQLYVDLSRKPNVSQDCAAVAIEYREKDQATQAVVLEHTSYADFSTCGPVSTNNFTKKDLVTIYPNPTHNIIKLNIHNNNVKSIYLSNIIGKQISRMDISNASNSIHQMSLQSLPKGMYLLQFKNASGKVLGVTRITKK